MDYYECSAKTGYNVENIFIDSASKISESIDKGNYDLTSGNNGIKMGIGAKGYKQIVDLNNNDNNKDNRNLKNKCC